MKDEVKTQFGQWPTAAAWFLVIAAFLLYVPFHRKADRKPAGVFAAFAVAFAFEMYGVPFSLYLMMGFFGRRLPEGVLGKTGHYLFLACLLLAEALLLPDGREFIGSIGAKRTGKAAWSGRGSTVSSAIPSTPGCC
jgi:hypothetical protein